MARRFFQKDLLSSAEARFYLRLKEAVPEFEVFPQVCMGAMVDPPKNLTGRYREKARYSYQSKIVDFTIFDAKEKNIVCLIEHDDPTHDSRRAEAKDVSRDAITAEAGYHTIRWDVRELPSVSVIRDKILQAKDAGPLEYVAPPEWARSAATQKRDFRGGLSGPLTKLKRQLIYVAAVVLFMGTAIAFVVSKIQSVSDGAINGMKERSAPAATKRDAPPEGYRQMVLLPRKAVVIKVPTCLAYGDSVRMAQAKAEGCEAKEVVGFPLGPDEIGLLEWTQFNKSRLIANEPCPTYETWATELVQDPALELGEKHTRLQALYDDAIFKGCMRAPM